MPYSEDLELMLDADIDQILPTFSIDPNQSESQIFIMLGPQGAQRRGGE